MYFFQVSGKWISPQVCFTQFTTVNLILVHRTIDKIKPYICKRKIYYCKFFSPYLASFIQLNKIKLFLMPYSIFVS